MVDLPKYGLEYTFSVLELDAWFMDLSACIACRAFNFVLVISKSFLCKFQGLLIH